MLCTATIYRASKMVGISLVMNEVSKTICKMRRIYTIANVLSNRYRILVYAIVYLYTIHGNPPFLSQIYRKVTEITGQNIDMKTVRTSVNMLIRHGMIYVDGNRYYAYTDSSLIELIRGVVDKLEEIKIYL